MKLNWTSLAEKQGYGDSDLADYFMLMHWYDFESLSAQTIADRLGISPTAVFTRLKELGIKTRTKNTNTKPWKDINRAIFKRR